MTGEPLGTYGEPVEVGVSFATMGKPTFLERIGLKKQQPRTQTMSFYVCCPACAEKVKGDPKASDYLVKVMQERMGIPPAPSASSLAAHNH
ncbi:MAG: hypothetical protein K2R98_15155 [Gemmataceae bacterium]|nr:hypothetical protein [Gemmataceae bacterium]